MHKKAGGWKQQFAKKDNVVNNKHTIIPFYEYTGKSGSKYTGALRQAIQPSCQPYQGAISK